MEKFDKKNFFSRQPRIHLKRNFVSIDRAPRYESIEAVFSFPSFLYLEKSFDEYTPYDNSKILCQHHLKLLERNFAQFSVLF
ncbi:hypothetical protein T10_406 [Trichinella papuae]|uniref:Uncharacterized protein n=1 Tax=Trichinella papuae TaxID=268474 RepID=A0A0V1N0H9_9BILA|nr:hypothetical protein T10_406 [Trichinella papuae]